MKREIHLTLLVVGLLFITGATASAQSSIQLTGTAGSHGAAARAGTEDDSGPVQYTYACTGAVLDEEYPYPLNVTVYLYVNSILQDWEARQGIFYVEVTTDTYFMSTAYDQPVDCYVYTTFSDLYVGDMAPGLPESESSEFWQWRPFAAADFIGRLIPQNGTFGGRTVTERPAESGWDSCWFQGSLFDQGGTVSGGTWTVQWHNGYGPDTVGWVPDQEKGDPVLYYRNQGQVPCDVGMPQEMVMQIPGTAVLPPFDWPYKVNLLMTGITDSSVWSYRDGVEVEIIYP